MGAKLGVIESVFSIQPDDPQSDLHDQCDREFSPPIAQGDKDKRLFYLRQCAAEMKKLEGTYFDREEKQYWQVQIQNDTLYCKGGILSKYIKLYPVGKKNFKITGTPYDISVNFKENDYDEPILEFRIPDIMWLWLVRVKEVNTSDYLGSYYSDELNTQYKLVEKENELFLTHQKLDDIKIVQINEAYFSSNNRNFSNIRFKRNKVGKIIEFSVSNESIENITFSRK